MDNNSNMLPFFVSGTLILILFVFYIIFILILYKNRQLRMVKEHKDKLVKARIEEHEKAMNALSAELHDNINQKLHLSRRQMGNIRRRATDDLQLEIIEVTTALLDDLIGQVGDISHSLNTNLVRQTGLKLTLEKEAAQINNTGLSCRVLTQGSLELLEEDQELNLSRIVQEALQNILKHADARAVEIKLSVIDDQLLLSIEDDGKGFKPNAELLSTSSLGLNGMITRATAIGATLDIRASPGMGTRITLSLPLNNNQLNSKA